MCRKMSLTISVRNQLKCREGPLNLDFVRLEFRVCIMNLYVGQFTLLYEIIQIIVYHKTRQVKFK